MKALQAKHASHAAIRKQQALVSKYERKLHQAQAQVRKLTKLVA